MFMIHSHSDSITIIKPSVPALVSTDWTPAQDVDVGEQVMIAVSLKNQNMSTVEFKTIIEVRRPSGVTEQLSWQHSDLKAAGENEIASSWIPTHPGEYELRTFCFSNLTENRTSYSSVNTSTVFISG